MIKQTTLTVTALTLALTLTSGAASAADFMTSNYRAYEVIMDCYSPNIRTQVLKTRSM